MGIDKLDLRDVEGVSPSFVEALYRKYAADPGSVEAGWRGWFEGLEDNLGGPSWARAGWPPAEACPEQ